MKEISLVNEKWKKGTFKAAKANEDEEKDNFSWWQTVLLAFASHASLQSKPGMIINPYLQIWQRWKLCNGSLSWYGNIQDHPCFHGNECNWKQPWEYILLWYSFLHLKAAVSKWDTHKLTPNNLLLCMSR